jgi:hypothetical protein
MIAWNVEPSTLIEDEGRKMREASAELARKPAGKGKVSNKSIELKQDSETESDHEDARSAAKERTHETMPHPYVEISVSTVPNANA